MKRKFTNRFVLICLGICFVTIYSCNDSNDNDEPVITTTPEVKTKDIYEITQTTANSGGIITSNGGDTITSKGICWSEESNPTIEDNFTTDGEGSIEFESKIIGLKINTNYYVRAYATNSNGISYGNEISFIIQQCSGEQVTDMDGNVYNSVIIGTQTWMVENLKATKFNNGIKIPLIENDTVWSYLSTPGYCWYNNDSSSNVKYGALYNCYTINTGNLAPTGWHVATNEDWTILSTYLGGVTIAGGKLKETGTTHWGLPNKDASDEVGFKALPGGYRGNNGAFVGLNNYGNWWTSTTVDEQAWFRQMNAYGSDLLYGSRYKEEGYSIRCVKD
jgi:uncharacterized protein (TIGR02145 family)